ncbi:MAG: apolipoprotein N-acyltransferase [Alphaproteobacteria bacterium]|nr:apolipoprotein N-acyltransferase [Alphaproteobacteria bacterium]
MAWLGGAVGAFAFAPFSLTILLVPAFGILVRLIDAAAGVKSAFRLGWWFAFGHFTLGLWWISKALLVDIDQFWWMVPFAIFALPAALALFPAIAIAVAKRMVPHGFPLAMALVLAWCVAEIGRGTLFTGFPWNLAGQSWGAYPVMAQTVSVYGIYGLSLVTVLAATLIGLGRLRPVAAGAALVAGLAVFGVLRLPADPIPLTETQIRLVQPNVPQTDKWKAELRAAHIQNLVDLTLLPPQQEGRPPEIVIWPETALPLILEAGTPTFRLLERLSRDRSLVTGAIRIDRAGGVRIFNSLFLFEGGALAEAYDKSHLVPFGEYVPFSEYLSFMRVAARVNFTPGVGLRTLEMVAGPAFSPLICYEIIFPGKVVQAGGTGIARPAWLVNLTNDAWYGVSNGPYQHRIISRIRAIEEGLPVARVANTGISELTDPYGRKVESLELNSRGIIDLRLPMPLDRTLFRELGGYILTLLFLTFSLFIISLQRVLCSSKHIL